MKLDVLNALSGVFPDKVPCKETLNHPDIINLVTGKDPFQNCADAFRGAWKALSIDIHSALPTEAPPPKAPGGTWIEGNTRYADLGVFPTSMPIDHMPEIQKNSADWVYQYNPVEDDFDLPGRIRQLRAANGEFRRTFGDNAVHYHLYYTTLFMWPVVKFDWASFMIAASLDPDRFDRHFWQPWAEISRKHVEALCAMDEEVVFTHDDLTMTSGPVFRPDFYDTYIFPRYDYIWEPVVKSGKKLIFVIDGNCDYFLERLLQFPISGIMYENPATPFDRVLETWGKSGRGFIGGIETALLTSKTPDEVYSHTVEVIEKGSKYPGFMISSCGGLHGNIPTDNMISYFKARNDCGIPAQLPTH